MSTRAQNVLFVLLGVAGLVLKAQYSGPYHDWVHSYGGNVTASFAVYFLARHLTMHLGFPKALAAGLALVVVELFEMVDGFGVMTNVYDRFDLAANAAGIALAVALDALASRQVGGRSKGWQANPS